ncbi:MAG: hypothetical protein MUF62_14265, partial [Chitinophagaceae bacterium]|nr:hypothetical protein [Chitinophagaceae bacterium]
MLANVATLGTLPVMAKFFPFYKRYLPSRRIDLPAITGLVFSGGLLLVLALLYLLQPHIVRIFGKNNPLFEPYYYTLGLFVILQGSFLFMELYAWFAGHTILANTLKELLFRVLTTGCLLLYWAGWVSFDGFMLLFGLIYLPATVIIVYKVRTAGGFPITLRLSAITRRLRGKMISLGSFVFLTTISNVAFVVCDTLFLASMYNFSKA